MYESHWGLKTKPFELSDPAFYYPAEGHQGALLKLRFALEQRQSAAVLCGPPGTGKTLLLDVLERQLGEREHVFVRISFPLMSPAELLAYLADRLAPEKRPSSNPSAVAPIDQSLRSLEQALSKLAGQQKRLVLVVDDAQAIEEPRTFEALRLLLNTECPNGAGPRLVMVGQTNLLITLERIPSFEERLVAKCLLAPFSVDDTSAYIVHRLKAAGNGRELFDASALAAVHAITQGVPRRINRLCSLAMMVGYAEERSLISAAQIEAVAEDLLVGTAA
jgi:general secretion pathway protein A